MPLSLLDWARAAVAASTVLWVREMVKAVAKAWLRGAEPGGDA
jgi:hypothetical protein